MTQFEIIDNNARPSGWFEVDPFDYEYDGIDPDGEVVGFLDDVADGTWEFDTPHDSIGDVEYPDQAPPAYKVVVISQMLESFDSIWFVDWPDDYNPYPIYG